MTEVKRKELIAFCVKATANLHDIDEVHIDRVDFTVMNNDDLLQEANWLVDVLDK